MKNLKDLLPKRHRLSGQGTPQTVFDEQTVFHIAKKVIREEYGLRGIENIIPVLYKEKKLFLASRSSLWGNEIWLERDVLKEKMNILLGNEAILEVKLERG